MRTACKTTELERQLDALEQEERALLARLKQLRRQQEKLTAHLETLQQHQQLQHSLYSKGATALAASDVSSLLW